MTLQSKILHLKLEAALAAKHADFWQRAIDIHGEDRATAFYKHLGLNHLEAKSFEYEGLTLSREPKEHEKVAVKGIAQAQESSKEAIATILLNLRKQLISDGLSGISQLPPAQYHELIIEIPRESRSDLRDRLIQIHAQGRMLVATELVNAKHCDHEWSLNTPFRCYKCLIVPEIKADEAEFDELDDLTDLTSARIANDVQSRITAAATRFSLLGQSGPNLIASVTNEVTNGSVAYIDRAATGLANKVISLGREDEAQNRSDEWGRVEYSALLDQNVCGPCASEDGQSATNEDDLTPTPNSACEGGDWCRCFHVYIQS